MDTAIRFLTAVAYAAVFMVSTSANAVVVLVGPGSPLSLGDGSTVTYGSAAANRVGYSGPATGAANDDFPSQNPDDVRGVIETVFGTSPLMNVGDCDGGGCTAMLLN